MQPASILILDDDAMLGEQLRSLLAVLGHPAQYCGDPSKAMVLLAEHSFELIFCDYWLPGPGGKSLHQHIIARMPELASRVIFLTGGVLGDETQFFIRTSGNLQLLKPFKLPAVKQVLAAAMQQVAADTSGSSAAAD
jgi:DNA-binding NtrC family response regulator